MLTGRAAAAALCTVACVLAPAACGGETGGPSGDGTSGAGANGGSVGRGGTSGRGGAGRGGTGTGGTGTGGTGSDVCSLPLETGNCLALIPRYGFNRATGRCESFMYGGCGGNANNFETAAECMTHCTPGTRTCAWVRCESGSQCVFLGAGDEPACLRPCLDLRACPPRMTCVCGSSCPGCRDCISVCVPLPY